MWRKRQLWPWCRYLTETRRECGCHLCGRRRCAFQLRQASETGSDSKKKYFLQTTTPLDYEKVKDYTIEIVAVDLGQPAHSPAPIPSRCTGGGRQ